MDEWLDSSKLIDTLDQTEKVVIILWPDALSAVGCPLDHNLDLLSIQRMNMHLTALLKKIVLQPLKSFLEDCCQEKGMLLFTDSNIKTISIDLFIEAFVSSVPPAKRLSNQFLFYKNRLLVVFFKLLLLISLRLFRL